VTLNNFSLIHSTENIGNWEHVRSPIFLFFGRRILL
jgi:hypothetical protein